LLQQRQELLLEAPLRMMLRLAIDVIHHCLALRLAHAEGAISLLPRKTRRFIQPSRGISFELLHRLRQRDGRRQRDEEVEMIGSSASSEQQNVSLARDS